MFNPCFFRQFYADFASVGKACADHNPNPSRLSQFINGFHSTKHRIVSITSRAIVTTPPMISAVIVSHFRHGLRRIGRRISEQVGCIVVCVVLCTVSVIVWVKHSLSMRRRHIARMANRDSHGRHQ
jgi:hypothetical protein